MTASPATGAATAITKSATTKSDESALRRSFAAHVFAPIKITRGQFMDLLVPFRHSTHIRRHAASVTISRVQLVSALFAVLVPLWSVVDWMIFPWPQWGQMAAMRCASGLIFLLLAWPWPMAKSRVAGDLMLLTMLLVPPLFYILSIKILDETTLTPLGALVARLYALMPNIMLAGLAIFPLTALEVMLFAVPAFLFAIAGITIHGETLSLLEHGPTLWLMVLVMGVAMFSGMSQLHYMVGLVNRATIDTLTGAFTRRAGGETLELMFRLSALHGAPLSLVFFDLDKFKSINDTYGHDEGDKALRRLAENVRKGLRRGDVLVRWGGEEFIAILNNTDPVGARTVVERLRVLGFGQRPDGSPMTASIGVAERCHDEADGWPQLVELADQRMYEAKRTGRDRAVLPDGVVIA